MRAWAETSPVGVRGRSSDRVEPRCDDSILCGGMVRSCSPTVPCCCRLGWTDEGVPSNSAWQLVRESRTRTLDPLIESAPQGQSTETPKDPSAGYSSYTTE